MYKAKLNFVHNKYHAKQGELWENGDEKILLKKGLLEKVESVSQKVEEQPEKKKFSKKKKEKAD